MPEDLAQVGDGRRYVEVRPDHGGYHDAVQVDRYEPRHPVRVDMLEDALGDAVTNAGGDDPRLLLVKAPDQRIDRRYSSGAVVIVDHDLDQLTDQRGHLNVVVEPIIDHVHRIGMASL